MMRGLVVVVVAVGCRGSHAVEDAPPAEPGPPPIDAAVRHWARQTLDEMLATGDPATPIFETTTPIIGSTMSELATSIGLTRRGSMCSGNWTHGSCHDTEITDLYLPGFVDDRPIAVYASAHGLDEHVTDYTLHFGLPEVDPDVVLAALRKKLGPPDRYSSFNHMIWIRNRRETWVELAGDLLSFSIEKAPDPPVKSTRVRIADCTRYDVALAAYLWCAKVPRADRAKPSENARVLETARVALERMTPEELRRETKAVAAQCRDGAMWFTQTVADAGCPKP